jgi:membrane protein DedA with SNARE-associated domain
MNVWRFTLLTFAGSYPWSLGLAWGGFALGDRWEDLIGWFRPVTTPIAIAVLLLIAYYLYRRVREALRGEPAALPGDDEP